jgi:hypothetical protein
MMRIVIAACIVLAAATAAAWAQHQNNPIIIVRNSSPAQNGALLLHLYAVPSHQSGGWGTDYLGRLVLGAQSIIRVHLPPGNCVFDVRLVFDNGFSAERRAVNACSSNAMGLVVDIDGGVFAPGGYTR